MIRTIAYKIIVLFFVLNFPAGGVFAEENILKTDGREHLRKGRAALEAGRYAEAVQSLSSAQVQFPLLEDYALHYLAEAYHHLGEHAKALDAVRMLLEKYPDSPVKKKARITEIREVKESGGPDLAQLYASFVRDYPDDEEINFMYAVFLREAGDRARAKSIFKDIFIRGGNFSGSAYGELHPSDIQTADFIERASNLAKRFEFAKAETDLRKALAMDDGSNRHEILKNIGLALFRQKKYKEAAEFYNRIDDTYSQARSFYRAGDKPGFDQALGTLLANNDKRAGYLLLAVAADKRRDRDYENALKTYNEVQNNYPPEAEEALWGAGWTHFVSGEYKKSSEVFSKLYATYSDPKYLYWQARSLEEDGGSSADLYRTLMKTDNNFYSFLSYARTRDAILQSVSLKETVFDAPERTSEKFGRVNALHSIGMSREAALELVALSRRIDSPDEFLYLISKFNENGDYRRAVAFATKLPYSEKMHRFWYPLAFWDTIEAASKKHAVDPFVILSVIREESRYDTEALSIAGARGLMQLMPETAYRLDKRMNLGINKPAQLYDVKKNVALGTYYLKSLFNEFNTLPFVLASYNAGEVIVRKWQQRGNYKSADEFIEDIPYPETRNYVKKVLTSYFQYKKYLYDDTNAPGIAGMFGKL